MDLRDSEDRLTRTFTHHEIVMKMQRAIHLGDSDHHDDGMHQVGAVSQPRERVHQPERQQAVDHWSRAGAALDHDEGYSHRPRCVR